MKMYSHTIYKIVFGIFIRVVFHKWLLSALAVLVMVGFLVLSSFIEWVVK
jgi:hypothetical protein